MKRLLLFLALIGGIGISAFASRQGIVLDSVSYFGPDRPWKDQFQYRTGWGLVHNPGDWISDPSTFPVNADGYPIAMIPGRWYQTYVNLHMLPPYYPAGNYVMTYKGMGDIHLQNDAVNISTAPNRYTFTVSTPSAAGINLFITNMDPNDPITKIRIVESKWENNQDEFEPRYLKLLSHFALARFVWWSKAFSGNQLYVGPMNNIDDTNGVFLFPISGNVLGAIAVGTLGTTTWQRRLIDSYNPQTGAFTVSPPWQVGTATGTVNIIIQDDEPRNWADNPTLNGLQDAAMGVSVQEMVNLANEIHIDPWFNIPTEATDDYVKQEAQYIHDNLDPTLIPRIEYSNETWNTAGPGYNYTLAMGQYLKLTGTGTSDSRFTALRSSQIFDIWSDVYGEDHLRKNRPTSRIVRVIATQAANSVDAKWVLTYPVYSDKNGNPTIAADHADALAIAPYYTFASTDICNKSSDQLIQDARTYLETNDKNWELANLKVANANGIPLITYEAGPGWEWSNLNGAQYAQIASCVADLESNPNLEGLVKEGMDQWNALASSGTIGLMTDYSFIGPCSQYGCWGHIPDEYTPSEEQSPKWLGIMDEIYGDNP